MTTQATASIQELVRAFANRHPDKLAIVFLEDGETRELRLTYGELDRRARGVASYLQSRHLPGARILLALPSGLEFVVSFLGCLYAGCVAVPLQTLNPQRIRADSRFRTIAEDCGATLVLTTERAANNSRDALAGALEFSSVEEAQCHDPSVWVPPSADTGRLAILQYTSGSTSTPRGVQITIANLTAGVTAIRDTFGLDEQTVGVSWLPLYHDMGLIGAVAAALFIGGTLVLMPPAAFMQRPARWLEALTRFKGNITTAPNFAYELCVAKITEDERRAINLGDLRFALTGAEPVQSATLEKFAQAFASCGFNREAFFPSYGLAEATLLVSGAKPSRYARSKEISRQALGQEGLVRPPNDSADALHVVSCGLSIADHELKIVNPETGVECPPGHVGEIWFRGPAVASGYWQCPAESASTFGGCLGKAAGFLRTGDLAFIEGNELFVAGRRKELIVIQGVNHYPVDLEITVQSAHPACEARNTATFTVPGEGTETLVIVQELPRLDSSEFAPVARRIRSAILESHNVAVQTIVFVATKSIPKTTSGKIQRLACRTQFLSNDLRILHRSDLDAATELESLLATIWSSVLEHGKEAGAQEDFFALGGHSLLATQVVSRVREKFGVELPLAAIFENPTLEGLARLVENARQGASAKAPDIKPVGRDSELPLSYAQQRLWFLDQLEPGLATYNIPAAVRLTGALDVPALAKSLSEIARRHEVLRTRFDVGEIGEPIQVIDPPSPWPLPVIDLSELKDRQQVARDLAAAEAKRPFDLATGPLFRTTLIRIAENEHILAAVQHHIISDGWSIGVLTRELTELYAAHGEGREARLPELAIQYADYAVWQRDWLSGEVLEKQVDFWRTALAGVEPLALPTDIPRTPEVTRRSRTLPVRINASTAEALRAVSRKESATLFMTLLAAWQVLLSRYSGQRDITVGTPIANRNRLETEPLIGFFVNTLALRTSWQGDPAFTELLAQVRRHVLEAYQQQDVPFERLVSELSPNRDFARSPLFQVMLVLQNTPQRDLRLGEAVLQLEEMPSGVGKYELILALEEELDGGLAGTLEYWTDLWHEESMERLISHWQTLLGEIGQHSEKSIGQLNLQGAPERTKLLGQGRGTVSQPSEATIAARFRAQADKTPDAIAVVFEEQQLSYRVLEERSNQIAHYLQSLGVGPEVRVALSVDRGLSMIEALLGILKAGGCYVPIDPQYPKARQDYLLRDSHAALRIDSAWLETAEIGKQPSSAPVSQTQSHHLAYVIYTSGSSGQPKGVEVEQTSVLEMAAAQGETFHLEPGRALLQFASLSFDAAVWDWALALLNGATLVLGAKENLLPGVGLEPTVARHQVTLASLPPGVLAALEPASLPSLETLIVSAEACPPELASRWSKTHILRNEYGPTEATVCVTMSDTLAPDQPAVPIGRPLANAKLYVVEENGDLAPQGVPGELWIGGSALARGYLHRPALTAERFTPDPFSTEPGARVYRTGDRVKWRSDGQLEFLGRFDNQIKLRGFRIELGEIEAALCAQPGIRQAAALLREDTPGRPQLVAYVAGEAVNTSELRQNLSAHLPEHFIPSVFVPLTALPLTPNGKIDRAALPAPIVNAYASNEPRTPQEELVADIFRTVLSLETISRDDNFFELGGHSLLATQVVSRVRQVFAVELPLQKLFEDPTVAGLTKEIGQLQGGVLAPPIIPVPRQNELPLSYAQHRLWFLDQLEPGLATYHMPAALRIQGTLDRTALQNSLRDLAARHEALRTHFVVRSGTEPIQVIDSAPSAWPLPVLNLSQTPDPEAAWRKWTSDEIVRPFNLKISPLLRTTLFKLSQNEHILVVVQHHIISDGWSIGVLTRELTELYAAHGEGREARLPELAIQYADYAVWQRDWLSGEVLEKQVDFWRTALAGVEPLALPTDIPRTPEVTRRSRTLPVRINASTAEALRAVSRKESATLFMTLLAAWQVLLSRYSGQRDITVGTPIANRNRLETEPLIGFFVNTLALRTSWQGDPAFTELLAQVRRHVLEAYQQQDVPFERLVSELSPNRDFARSPLFQVMLVLQNTPQRDLRLGEAVLQLEEMPSGVGKYELILALEEELDGGLAGTLEYWTDLWHEESMERLISHWQTLLGEIGQHSEKSIGQLNLQGAPERTKLLGQGRGTVSQPSEATIAARFRAQADKTPDAIAVVFEEQQLSYRVLEERSNQIAHYLQSLGVGPEVRVALSVDRGLSMIEALLGILKAGGCYVPIDPQYPKARQDYLLRDSHAALRIDSAWLETAEIGKQPSSAPVSQTQSHHLAYVIYTSGSSGQPKGVEVEQTSVLEMAAAQGETFHLEPGRALLQFASLSFDAAVWDWALALLNGATLVLGAKENLLPGVGLEPTVARHQVTLASLPPGVLAALEPASLPSLETLIVSAEACPPELASRWSKTHILRNEYGPTEATVCVTMSDTLAPDQPAVPIGRPLANAKLYVVEENGDLAPQGVPGELWIGGSALARGYLHRPALTAERFTPDPFSTEPGARVYRTGDRVKWRSDGQLEFLGRFDNQIKLRGFRIELGEIEAALCAQPGIRQAAALLREDTPGRPQLVAYVAGEAVNTSELRQNLSAHLPEHFIPSVFVPLTALPLTPNGKIDRAALPAPIVTLAQTTEPSTPTEFVLRQVWQDVLSHPNVDINQNFFELGGDSILSIQVVNRAQQAGISLTVRQIFEHQTIAALALAIDSQSSEHPTLPAPQEILIGSVLLTPIQSWFFNQERKNPSHFNQAVLLDCAEPVDIPSLAAAVEAVGLHHDALRLRYNTAKGQHFTGEENLPALSIHESHADNLVEELQHSLSLERGPLAHFALIRGGMAGSQSDNLLCIVHHLVIDAVSWRILLEDLLTAYRQTLAGEPIILPRKTNSFGQWSEALHDLTRSTDLIDQRHYWLSVCATQNPALPVDHPIEKNLSGSAATVSEILTPRQTEVLLHLLLQRLAVSLQDAILSALAEALHEWSARDSWLIELESHGRQAESFGLNVTRTVGWFTALYPFRLERNSSTAWQDQIQTIAAELRAVPASGIGYGILRYLSSDEILKTELARSTIEISFNYLGQIDHNNAADSIWKPLDTPLGPLEHPSSKRSHVLEFSSMISGGRLHLNCRYNQEIHHSATISNILACMAQSLVRIAQDLENSSKSALEEQEEKLSEEELQELMAANADWNAN